MSYEDTNCPCGGKKRRRTMLCAECIKAFAARSEMRTYQDETQHPTMRQHAALILISLARGRKARATP